MRKGMTLNLLEDFIKLGIYNNEELTDSLKRLYQQELVEIIKDEDGIHFLGFKLTGAGEQLWNQLQDDYDYATEVMFRGMTDEQIETYKRLTHMVIYNIDKEVEGKRDNKKGE